MKKVIRPCTIRTWGGRWISVFCKIEFQDKRLSISGVEGPTQNGDAHGNCGQIDMSLRKLDASEIRFAPNWDAATFKRFLDIWDKWHLNDLHAECEHQEARGETWKTHPWATCPDCGYVLGAAWTFREVPQNVLDWLFSLPDTDKTPAWV